MTATLYEWAGGMEAVDALAVAFSARARVDDELVVLFGDMPEEHPDHVAVWLAEVMGGPDACTRERGGYAHMLAMRLGLAITPAQRARGVTLISAAADPSREAPVPRWGWGEAPPYVPGG